MRSSGTKSPQVFVGGSTCELSITHETSEHTVVYPCSALGKSWGKTATRRAITTGSPIPGGEGGWDKTNPQPNFFPDDKMQFAPQKLFPNNQQTKREAEYLSVSTGRRVSKRMVGCKTVPLDPVSEKYTHPEMSSELEVSWVSFSRVPIRGCRARRFIPPPLFSLSGFLSFSLSTRRWCVGLAGSGLGGPLEWVGPRQWFKLSVD